MHASNYRVYFHHCRPSSFRGFVAGISESRTILGFLRKSPRVHSIILLQSILQTSTMCCFYRCFIFTLIRLFVSTKILEQPIFLMIKSRNFVPVPPPLPRMPPPLPRRNPTQALAAAAVIRNQNQNLQSSVILTHLAAKRRLRLCQKLHPS